MQVYSQDPLFLWPDEEKTFSVFYIGDYGPEGNIFSSPFVIQQVFLSHF